MPNLIRVLDSSTSYVAAHSAGGLFLHMLISLTLQMSQPKPSFFKRKLPRGDPVFGGHGGFQSAGSVLRVGEDEQPPGMHKRFGGIKPCAKQLAERVEVE